MQHWFRSGGDPVAADMLEHQLRQLMPRVPFQSITRDACAVSFTQTGLPYIETVSDRLTLVTGGNGAAAKSCVEIGRLGALTALGQDITPQGYDSDFRAVLA
jgi:sarcosine oxidase